MVSFAEQLYKIGAIKVGNFTLKSGDTSPFYIDLRLIPSYPKLFKSTIKYYQAMLNDLYKNKSNVVIGGIMSAGIPFATALCLEEELPLVQIRSSKKDHGTKKMIEGKRLGSEETVVLIDDLISTGASKLEPIEVIRNTGAMVKDILVLIDRRKKKEMHDWREMGIKIHSAFTIFEILEGLLISPNLNPDDRKTIEDSISQWA